MKFHTMESFVSGLHYFCLQATDANKLIRKAFSLRYINIHKHCKRFDKQNKQLIASVRFEFATISSPFGH